MSIGYEHEDMFKILLKCKKYLLIINSPSDVCFDLVASLVSVETRNCLLVNTCYLESLGKCKITTIGKMVFCRDTFQA